MTSSSPAEVRLRWRGPGRGFSPVEHPGNVRIVDSWLVAEGRTRAFDVHARRFGAACDERFGIEAGQTLEFLRAGITRIPASGRWFPRAELALVSGAPRLQLWIRPAPLPGHAVRLWLPGEPDARICPRIKGPDLNWLAGQRASAAVAGADEAVLLSPAGRVVEGASTSILWWRGGALCTPPPDARLLPGVTRSVLLDAACAGGVPVVFETPFPADLSGLEVWAVNALHGIRPVTGWVGADIAPGSARRAARWQRYLDEIATDVSGLAAVSHTDHRKE